MRWRLPHTLPWLLMTDGHYSLRLSERLQPAQAPGARSGRLSLTLPATLSGSECRRRAKYKCITESHHEEMSGQPTQREVYRKLVCTVLF